MPYVVHREGAPQVGRGLAWWVVATQKSLKLPQKLKFGEPRLQLICLCHGHWCHVTSQSHLQTGSTFLLFMHCHVLQLPSVLSFLSFFPSLTLNRFLLQNKVVLGPGPAMQLLCLLTGVAALI